MARWTFSMVLLLLSAAACTPPVPRDPFAVGDVMSGQDPLSAPVREYFDRRRLALAGHDPEILWTWYPALRSGEDLASGVNTEGWLVARSDTARISSDVTYELERYAPMRKRAVGADVVVRVHGLERYMQRATPGTAGEFILDLYLKLESGSWTVVKTDEMTLSEYHEAARQSR